MVRRFAVIIGTILCCVGLAGSVGGGAQSQLQRPSARFPRFDRVLLLRDPSWQTAGVSIGDLDGDGALDLVFASGGHTAAIDYLLLNDGRGAFPVMRPLGDARDRSFSAALADLDGDGSLDIVIGNQDPDPKVSYLDDGKGHFHPGSTYGRPEWPGRAAGLADLNGDEGVAGG
jgi:hypothetical protein